MRVPRALIVLGTALILAVPLDTIGGPPAAARPPAPHDALGDVAGAARPLPTSPLKTLPPVILRPSDAAPARTRPMYSVENFHPGWASDRDRVNGITDDHLVARTRFTIGYHVKLFGLWDPASRQTRWLPRPSVAVNRPYAVQLGADRLVYVDFEPARLLVFDRTTQTWSTPEIQVPPGFRGMTPYFEGARISGDRLYYPGYLPGTGVTWWSVLVSTGGSLRQESGVPAVAGSLQASVDDEGNLTVTDDGHQVMSAGPPAGCAAPAAPNGVIGASVMFAGTRPVVGYSCAGGLRTVVYNARGPAITLCRRVGWMVAADSRYVLFSGPLDRHIGGWTLFVLDLRRGHLRTLPAPWATTVTPWLSGSLVSWDTWGPHTAHRDRYDVIYRVDRIERGIRR
jgi:hypothetical protein